MILNLFNKLLYDFLYQSNFNMFNKRGFLNRKSFLLLSFGYLSLLAVNASFHFLIKYV